MSAHSSNSVAEKLAQVDAVAGTRERKSAFQAVWTIDNFRQLIESYRPEQPLMPKLFTVPLLGGEEKAVLTIACYPLIRSIRSLRVDACIALPSSCRGSATKISFGLLDKTGEERTLHGSE
jgi:hypothetical protein